MKTRQIVTIIIVIVIVGGSFGLMSLFSGMKELPEQKAVAEIVKFVKTEKVIYSDVFTKVEGFGRTSSSQPLDVIAEVNGRIINGNIPLKEGQRFHKGDLLFSIDDTEAKLQLKSKKSTFLKSIASILPDFKIDYPNSFDTWQAYFESIELDKPLPELPEYKNNQEKTYLATKNIFTDFYSIRSDEFNLTKHKIYAPFNGTISEVSIYPGTFASGGNKIAKILETNNLELKVAVSIDDVSWLKIGKEINISTENNMQQWQGKIVRIGDFVNENTQSIDVFVQLYPGQEKVYEGMYLRATMPGKVVNEGMEIPRNAVFNGSQVYTVEDSLLKVNDIKIHKINSETVVFTGIDAGKDIVVEPLVNAYNNMKVGKLKEPINVEVANTDSK
ncbi:MAG: efflux transporter periplasmic adaptor subunit [Thalassobius sp.]|nr:efflux transporter periplasmic adaptor subunit [Thalassovita sp.]